MWRRLRILSKLMPEEELLISSWVVMLVIQQGSSIRLLTLCSTNALYRYSFVWRKSIHICEPLKAGNRRTEILHVRSPAGRATATSETMRKRNTGDKCNSTNNIPSEKWKRHGFSKPKLFKKYRPESSASAATRDYKSTNEDKLDRSSRLHQCNALCTKKPVAKPICHQATHSPKTKTKKNRFHKIGGKHTTHTKLLLGQKSQQQRTKILVSSNHTDARTRNYSQTQTDKPKEAN